MFTIHSPPTSLSIMKNPQVTVRIWSRPEFSRSSSSDAPNWKPFRLSPFFILPISLLHVLCIIGIQLIAKKYTNDQAQITLVQANTTLSNPDSIFIFSESNLSSYLSWQYLPVSLLTLLLVLPWEGVDVSVRRLEPFRQLSSASGGDVDNALGLDYVGMLGYLVPLAAMRRGHWAVVVSSSVYILSATVLPVLVGGIWGVQWGSLTFSAGKTEGDRWAAVTMSGGIATAAQVCHGVAAGAGLVLAGMLWGRRTGVYRDPKGMGGIAGLISDIAGTESDTLRLVRQIPSFAHSDVVRHALRGITFGLRHVPVMHPDGRSGTAYQLVALNVDPARYVLPIVPGQRVFAQDRMDATGFWLTKRALLLTECIFWLGQAAITVAVYKVATFAGAGEGAKPTVAKMVFTLTITIGGMMWQSIQREVQVFEPWRRLARRERGPGLKRETVDSDTVGLGVLGSAVLGGLVGAWSAFSMVMVYVATIFLPPLLELAYSAGYITNSPFPTKEFGVMAGSTALGLAVTGVVVHLVIFLDMVFLIWSGRTRAFLPRRPTTLASHVVYLCRSERLLGSFRGMSMVSGTEMGYRLQKVERWCRFGWFQTFIGGVGWCFVGVEECSAGQGWWEFEFARRELVGVL
ncbi:hypothetical protein GE09DRAFT_1181320 [Coniochaeta sp. 2T2.1]|nr:hypothetical protein GE09DRAFT_1181320 [Coniochaeta sp. 2T2.1]